MGRNPQLIIFGLPINRSGSDQLSRVLDPGNGFIKSRIIYADYQKDKADMDFL
jgi:hypothetical protein